MLVIVINNRNKRVIVFSVLIAGSVSLGTGSEHLWAHLHKNNTVADETCVPYIYERKCLQHYK